jgi:hypothetical protein
MTDREHLQSFLTALDAWTRALRRDDCNDWAISGRYGTIYRDGDGYILCITTGESARRWGFVKKRLAFCRITQDGDDEGCLHLNRLPTSAEADIIREAMGIRQRRRLTPETLNQLDRARAKSPLQAQGYVR